MMRVQSMPKQIYIYKKASSQIAYDNNKKDNNLMMLLLGAAVTSECETHNGHIQLSLIPPTLQYAHTRAHTAAYVYFRAAHTHGLIRNRNSEG